MGEALSPAGLVVALVLPWFAGAVWVSAILRRSGRCNLTLVLGHGYFLGLFAATALLRLWDAFGGALSFPLLAGLLAALSLPAVVLTARDRVRPAEHGFEVPSVLWQRVLVAGLLALVAWRYQTVMQEMLSRPLYAWDAWVNWAPKAIVWFHLRELTEFISPHQWLLQDIPEAYTLGNWRASVYPETVPLIQLWVMLGAGVWDSSAIYIPWVVAPLALGLALYGHLRLAGQSSLAAALAVYLLLSQPYINVHSALVGYADIWLAGAFGLAVFALYEWRRSRHWAYALLCVLLAALCASLKNPGMVLAAIIIVALAYGGHVRARWPMLALIAAAPLLLAVGMSAGLSADIPYLGSVSLQNGSIVLGRLGQVEIAYYDVLGRIGLSLFGLVNWHLFWYAVPLILMLGVVRADRVRLPSAEGFATALALAFVTLVFLFTGHANAAEDLTTLNRAFMYPVPGLVFCGFLLWHRLAVGQGGARRGT